MACEAELFADSLQLTLLDAGEKDAHVFEAGTQLIFSVAGVLLQRQRPLA